MERLQKYLASCGVASRRAAERLIEAGRVKVNGSVVSELGSRVDPGLDRVEVDGREVRPPTGMVYLAVNKPPGYISTVADTHGRRTVVELVPQLGRLFPVGRLDADSEGLLLMTNDGELANRLMHPRYGCDKEYRALVDRPLDRAAIERLRQGVELEDGPTGPAEAELEKTLPSGQAWLRVTLREGRRRQVRRMLAAVGATVERLQRVRIGPLELRDLPRGASRPLSRSEIAALRSCVAVEP